MTFDEIMDEAKNVIPFPQDKRSSEEKFLDSLFGNSSPENEEGMDEVYAALIDKAVADGTAMAISRNFLTGKKGDALKTAMEFVKKEKPDLDGATASRYAALMVSDYKDYAFLG